MFGHDGTVVFLYLVTWLVANVMSFSHKCHCVYHYSAPLLPAGVEKLYCQHSRLAKLFSFHQPNAFKTQQHLRSPGSGCCYNLHKIMTTCNYKQ